MKKIVISNGALVAYATNDSSHCFEVRCIQKHGNPVVYTCEVKCKNRVRSAATANSRIEAIRNAYVSLQTTDYKLPFGDYRMADILTGQF